MLETLILLRLLVQALTCSRQRFLDPGVCLNLVAFLCAAERVSPWALGVSATASVSDPPRSPPGAARARSGCRWWSGCTGSWRAPSGRPRRTKRPRDWCSSGRWDAGPSDNLWSQSGEEEEEEEVVVRRRRGRAGGRCATATVPCSAAERTAAFRGRLVSPPSTSELSGSHNRSQSVSSLGRYHENIPQQESQQRTVRDALCLLFFFFLSSHPHSESFLSLLFLKCYMDHRKKGGKGQERKNVSGKTPWTHTDATASLKKKHNTKNAYNRAIQCKRKYIPSPV